MTDSSFLTNLRDFFFHIEEGALKSQVSHGNGLEIYLTNCTTAESGNLAETLVREQLAACVNVIPGARSYYVWEGELVVDSEDILLIKTMHATSHEMVARLRELHSYTTPEILELKPNSVSSEYLQWAEENTK